jgi:hypothetical protein
MSEKHPGRYSSTLSRELSHRRRRSTHFSPSPCVHNRVDSALRTARSGLRTPDCLDPGHLAVVVQVLPGHPGGLRLGPETTGGLLVGVLGPLQQLRLVVRQQGVRPVLGSWGHGGSVRRPGASRRWPRGTTRSSPGDPPEAGNPTRVQTLAVHRAGLRADYRLTGDPPARTRSWVRHHPAPPPICRTILLRACTQPEDLQEGGVSRGLETEHRAPNQGCCD